MQSRFPHLGNSHGSAQPECNGQASPWVNHLLDHGISPARGERERSPPLPQIMQSRFPHLGNSHGSAQPECNGQASPWVNHLLDHGISPARQDRQQRELWHTLVEKRENSMSDNFISHVIRGERERSPPLPQIMQSRFPHLGNSHGSAQPECNGQASPWVNHLLDHGISPAR
ncbi:hypothetical protein NQZ68_017869 [Dissostichus eleginoides]|nr:hypothetical protein NQZ68_017869 [Dissostichus eleginoides]